MRISTRISSRLLQNKNLQSGWTLNRILPVIKYSFSDKHKILETMWTLKSGELQKKNVVFELASVTEFYNGCWDFQGQVPKDYRN